MGSGGLERKGRYYSLGSDGADQTDSNEGLLPVPTAAFSWRLSAQHRKTGSIVQDNLIRSQLVKSSELGTLRRFVKFTAVQVQIINPLVGQVGGIAFALFKNDGAAIGATGGRS